MAHNAQNVYSLAPYRKSLLIPVLNCGEGLTHLAAGGARRGAILASQLLSHVSSYRREGRTEGDGWLAVCATSILQIWKLKRPQEIKLFAQVHRARE